MPKNKIALTSVNGFVFYHGPSELDGSTIVAIATGLIDGGSNSKTGPMVQIYFLPADRNPMQAVQTGHDASVCGSCRLRGEVIRDPKTDLLKNVGRACYVTLFQGPRVVYDAFQRGVYPHVSPEQARRLLAGKKVRVGAYGDAASVPFEVLEVVLDKVPELTGFTHAWRKFPQLSAFCMASVESEAERLEARELGFRTYRVREPGAPVMKGEGQCPASDELGKAVQCVGCMLCGGHRTKAKADLTIISHGARGVNFRAPVVA